MSKSLGEPLDKTDVFLSSFQYMSRVRGVWWDIFYLSVGAIAIILVFLFSSIALLTGNLGFLPFSNVLWSQFLETVGPDRQSEIGLGLLSVTVSGMIAVALYLVRVGTRRWTINSRVGHSLVYFAQTLSVVRKLDTMEEAKAAVGAFLDSSNAMYETVGDCHKAVQEEFEISRGRALVLLRSQKFSEAKIGELCTGLYVAALIANKKCAVLNPDKDLTNRIRLSVAKHLGNR